MMMKRESMSGLSLIELLVAMTIALVAILAAVQLYSSTRQTYRVQAIQNRLSEDGRFAISMLQRVITQAGFRPTPTAWTGTGFPTGQTTPVTASSATSMIVHFYPDDADGSGAGTTANQIGCNGAPVASNTPRVALRISGDSDALTCGLLKDDGTLNGTAVPWIAPATSGAGASTELVDFLLEYGSDTKSQDSLGNVIAGTVAEFGCGLDVAGAGGALRVGDCVADDYTLAKAQATPLDIVAVRACLVLRSEATDSSIDKMAAWKDCSGANIAGSQDDRRLYRTFRTTVLLRNH
ncbi:MAG: PilW family protein [Azonexus sp.]|jgi:type II secretory pathway pseudopilin PulG|nr:PilW family protein [Azonexus sp.]